MTRPFAPAFKAKMIERLTGKNAVSASQLARETGIRQQSLSRWLEEARTLPLVTTKKPSRSRSVDEKVKILATVTKLTGDELGAFLAREGLRLAEVEQWRLALDDEGRSSKAVTSRIRRLERELARKEKALAEAAALLVLKKNSRMPLGAGTTTRTRRTRGDSRPPRRGRSQRRQLGPSLQRRRGLVADDPALACSARRG